MSRVRREDIAGSVDGEVKQLADSAGDEPASGITEPLPGSFFDFAPDFLAINDPALEYIIPEFTPRGVIKQSHGDPRTMKTLAALEEAVSASTGTAAFGMERFKPSRKFRVLYSSQEDSASIIRPRVKGLLRARGITEFPAELAFSVHKGIDFDDSEWRERFFQDTTLFGFEFIVIDPIRAFTANADKGPTDVMPLAKYFRRFTVLGITVHLIHHDVKPPASGPDTRRRSHRASGGAWFSVSECPVAFEKIGDSQSLVSPEDYKISADPKPFTFTYIESEGDAGKIIRLQGETSSAQEAHALAIDEKVLAFLTEHNGASGNAISKGIHARREDVTSALQRLTEINKVDSVERGKRRVTWFLKGGAQ